MATRAITNSSEIESRSSRRRTRTLRNTFNHEANNQLSEIFSNYFDATARLQHEQHQLLAHQEEEQRKEQKLENSTIQQQHLHNRQVKRIKHQISAAKDELIKKLEQNNRNITIEVQKIWEKIHQMNLVKQPVKKQRRKLFQEEQNSQKLQKDLQNAYKWIKIAEKEMNVYRSRQLNTTDFVDKLKKLKQDLSEREIITNRIKNEIVALNKELKQNEKIITTKLQIQSGGSQLKVLSDQLNYLYELVKQTEKKEEQRVNILKKQYVSVKKIERELVERGMSEFQLQQIKKKCVRQFPSKNQLQSSKPQHKKEQLPKQQKRKQQKEHNHKNLEQMLSEISLLEKKQAQFDKEYTKLKVVKIQYAEKNKGLQQKIRNCQIEYQELETLNQKLRSKHFQHHRRKKMQTASKQLNQASSGILRDSLTTKKRRILVKQKNKRYKSLPSTSDNQKQTKEKPIKKRNCIFGEGSKGCNKFNDKYLLSAQNRGKKIVGLVTYFQPQKLFIAGISAMYEEGAKGGDYVQRLAQNQLQYKVQSVDCGQAYIKDIIPSFENQNGRSKLVGLGLLLSNDTIKKLGKVTNEKSQLEQNEYVSCICGSMSILQQNEKHTSVIQQLGFEIYQ